jgi:hypothetical protein
MQTIDHPESTCISFYNPTNLRNSVLGSIKSDRRALGTTIAADIPEVSGGLSVLMNLNSVPLTAKALLFVYRAVRADVSRAALTRLSISIVLTISIETAVGFSPTKN